MAGIGVILGGERKDITRDAYSRLLYGDYYPGKFEDPKYNSVNLYGDYYPGMYTTQQPLSGGNQDNDNQGNGNGGNGNTGGGSGTGNGNKGNGNQGSGNTGGAGSGAPSFGTVTPPANPYGDLLAQLEQAKAEKERRIQAARQNQLSQANTSYNDLEQQAYIQKMQALQNHPTQMALTGQTGGLSETAALAPQLSYGNALDAYGRDRANMIAQINAALDEQSITSADAYNQQIYSVRAAQAQQEYENQLAAQQAQNEYGLAAYKAWLEAEAKKIDDPKNTIPIGSTTSQGNAAQTPVVSPIQAPVQQARIDQARRILSTIGWATDQYKAQYLNGKGFTKPEITAALSL